MEPKSTARSTLQTLPTVPSPRRMDVCKCIYECTLSPIATSNTRNPNPNPHLFFFVFVFFAVTLPRCDAAVPCGPSENCCAYKQGDGDVPHHDWTFEETLSGVVMQAEQLLISRNTSGILHHLPLFARTSQMLEARYECENLSGHDHQCPLAVVALYFFYNQFMLTCAIDIAVIRTSHLLRRDQMTAYTTILTGPSSNLLAPSFGGSPLSNGTFGGWAALTGVHVYGRWIAGLSLLEGVAGGGTPPHPTRDESY